MNATLNYGFNPQIVTQGTIDAFSAVDRDLKRVEDKADAALTQKVDKVEGHTLIPAGRLEQITRNESRIECLSTRLADAKAEIADRYTKDEVDAKLENKTDKADFEAHVADLSAHQELFDKKVDKVPGSGLIPDEQLKQIAANKDSISKMYTQDEVDALLADKVNAIPFTEHFLSPATGFSGWIRYHKNAIGEVSINFLVYKSDGSDIPSPSNTIIGTMPAGFRPVTSGSNDGIAVVSGGSRGSAAVSSLMNAYVYSVNTTDPGFKPGDINVVMGASVNTIYGSIHYYAG